MTAIVLFDLQYDGHCHSDIEWETVLQGVFEVIATDQVPNSIEEMVSERESHEELAVPPHVWMRLGKCLQEFYGLRKWSA